MKIKSKDAPQQIRSFMDLGFDYQEKKDTGDEVYGQCPFCGSKDKFYINKTTGMWDCKAGKCQKSGNIYSFMNYWYNTFSELVKTQNEEFITLANDRQLPPDFLKKNGIVYDGFWYYIPVRNASGALVGFRRYNKSIGTIGISEIDQYLYGLELLADDDNAGKKIYLCEGEWDTLAMRYFISTHKVKNSIAVGVPGAGIWKSAWTDQFIGKDVVICYDHDAAGEKGTAKVHKALAGKVSSFEYIEWLDILPDGFDVRDFVIRDGTIKELRELIKPYLSAEEKAKQTQSDLKNRPNIFDKGLPVFSEIVELFKAHYHLTEDIRLGLKLIYAVMLSNQIDGEPLWLQIVGPPGTCKTEMLMTLAESPTAFMISSLTGKSLVSGYIPTNGSDPSLLPQLEGRVLVLKDFTEILTMGRIQKDETYSVFRGVYDGSVERSYANGATRSYTTKFNMVTGVTPAIFAEKGAGLGPRFLYFHLVKGVGYNAKDAIKAAIRNVGKEKQIRQDLKEVVKNFVEVSIPAEDVPDFPEEIIDKVVALAGLVAMLRADVERIVTHGESKLTHRPQHEMGTRPAKQLTKLAYGLALVDKRRVVTDEDYKILTRVALDTCVGFNLEAVKYVIEKNGSLLHDVSDALELPITTLRGQFDDMFLLGILRKEDTANTNGKGRPMIKYHATDIIKQYWKEAGLSKSPAINSLQENREITRKYRRVRKHSIISND